MHAPKVSENPDAQMEDTPQTSQLHTIIENSLPDLTLEESHLRAHLAVAETNRSIIRNSSSNQLSGTLQFTPAPPGGFPRIHYAHSAQIFDHQSPKVINAWLKVAHPKVLFRVFDYDGRDPSGKTPILVERARKTITEIGNAAHHNLQNLRVSPPCPEAGREEFGYPLSFLAYNITEEVKSILLTQRIWSSPEITFEVQSFNALSLPKLLLCLHGFTTQDSEVVRTVVYDTWAEDVARWDIGEILAEGEISTENTQMAAWSFVESARIERIDFKVSGGLSLPRYNIFADSPTGNPDTWTKLRAYLLSLSYQSDLDGRGVTVNFIPCTLCHSIAHPRGLCPFPDIPLWNGPKHSTKPPPTAGRGRGRGRRNNT
jgi:hypothetical protein